MFNIFPFITFWFILLKFTANTCLNFSDHSLRNGPAGAPSFGMDVTIEDDCWIGGHVTILGGVTVGKGCVIGANSLVTKVSRIVLHIPSQFPLLHSRHVPVYMSEGGGVISYVVE
jgi:acetyltransferase-like isoleucine patch superfamily enzyme